MCKVSFLFLETISYKNKKGVLISKKAGHFKCDSCNIFFDRQPKPKALQAEFHFCSRLCVNNSAKHGNFIYNKKQNNFIINYGETHHLKSKSIREKIKQTCLKKYGGHSPLSSQDIKNKISETNILKYGGHPCKNINVLEKKKATCLKKYGQDSFSKTDEFKFRLNWAEISKKGFETKKRNGISPRSKIELKFELFLKENFLIVENQINVNNWWIDFYLQEKDTYIQFNGDYWHGYERTQEQLMSSNSKQDKVIAATKLRDSRKEVFFKENNMKLITVRDYEFKNKKYDLILERINEGVA